MPKKLKVQSTYMVISQPQIGNFFQTKKNKIPQNSVIIASENSSKMDFRTNFSQFLCITVIILRIGNLHIWYYSFGTKNYELQGLLVLSFFFNFFFRPKSLIFQFCNKVSAHEWKFQLKFKFWHTSSNLNK